MAFLGSDLTSEVGLRLLLWPLGSNIVTRAACCSVGVVLPVYSTFRAIERNNEREQQKWLTYWAAYGSFTLVETFSDKLLSWFPYYYHFKFAFLVWLQLPSTEGAKQIYRNHLRPNLLKHQARVDQLMGFASAEMQTRMLLVARNLLNREGYLRSMAQQGRMQIPNLIVKMTSFCFPKDRDVCS
ncbi:hypothetical protein HRI_004544000 [Hibiscus trionum]|uniref:HVA22-like protein n=1 Tax=Hibiscus trionum TaxID=183268 RepID=A0A9W7J5Y0_HIBTR|nr:hypothetical protein HRI_004544000 [Hibiscus trionum]